MRRHLAHLLTPRHSNNHRARLLHPAGLAVLIGLFLSLQLTIDLVAIQGGAKGYVLGFASSITPGEIITSTNDQRALAGLAPLTTSEQLTQAAIAKANDMFANNYWAHISPSGTTPWVFIKNTGYSYSVAGENLARDFDSTGNVIDAWMNSPTHKANIIHQKYTQIGVGVVNGILDGTETTLVVQMFGTPTTAVAAISPDSAQTEIRAQSLDVPQDSEPAPTEPVQVVEPFIEPITPEEIISDVVPEPQEEVAIIPETTLTVPNSDLSPGSVVLSDTIASRALTFPISPVWLTRVFALAILMLLMGVLVNDLHHASHKNLFRLVGKNWGHIGFFSMVLIVVLVISEGSII